MKSIIATRDLSSDLIAVRVPETGIAPLDPDQLGQLAEDAMRSLLVTVLLPFATGHLQLCMAGKPQPQGSTRR